jgi:hypothetical protein
MISTGTNRIVLSVTLAGIVTMATACTLHTQTRRPSEVKGGTPPNSGATTNGVSTNGTTSGSTGGATTGGATTTSGRSTGISTPELMPMSAPAASQPREVSPPSEPQAPTTRPPNDADDPRAVIDWLLDRSSRGR